MNSLFSTIIDIVWFIDHRYDRFVFNNSGNILGLLFGNMYCISSLPFVIHRNEACAFAYRSNYLLLLLLLSIIFFLFLLLCLFLLIVFSLVLLLYIYNIVDNIYY